LCGIAGIRGKTGRGAVLTNADSAPINGAAVFGPQSFHSGDHSFYYKNIKDNAAKRIAAFKSAR